MGRLKALQHRPRVIYRRNPLVHVVAAVMFPPQLKIAEKIPVIFQERVKSRYPRLQILRGAIAVTMLNAVRAEASALPAVDSGTIYRFESEDQKYQVSLAPNQLALTTTAYSNWEDFRGRFYDLLDVLYELYSPPIVERVGLRYQDVIDREALGLREVAWTDLLEPDLLKPLAFFSQNVDDDPHFTVSSTLGLEDGSININYGFVRDPNGKLGFLIDTDCYADNQRLTTAGEIKSALEGFHGYTALVFRSAITDRVHFALEPYPVPHQ